MNYRTERQETASQNKTRFEEAYFQTAFNVNNYNDNTKEYTYEIPQQFATNPSQENMIGLRLVKLTTIMANFIMKVSYEKLVCFQFQPKNTLQEICNKITEETTSNDYALLFNYECYNLTIVAVNTTDYSTVPFEFVFMDHTRDTANILWQVFNQTGYPFPTMFTYDNTGTITATTEI